MKKLIENTGDAGAPSAPDLLRRHRNVLRGKDELGYLEESIIEQTQAMRVKTD